MILRNSASRQAIDDNEVRLKFQQFGEIKSVNPVDDHAECVLSFTGI
jgi:transcription initiation factor TFIID subunit 15